MIVGSIESIFDARIQDVQDEIELNRERLNLLLASDKVSEEVKTDARRKSAVEEDKLEKKKKKREKQAFLGQQAVALAEIGINLAKQIALIQTTAASLDAISLGTLGTPYRIANTPLAYSIAATSAGLVLAQSIPQFYGGKTASNNHEGLATWGERGREVLIGEDGSMTVSPDKTTPIMLRKNDLIVPSIGQFDTDMNNPDSDVFKRVNQKMNHDTDKRSQPVINNNTMDLTPLKGLITKELRNALKGVTINVDGNNNSQDNYEEY